MCQLVPSGQEAKDNQLSGAPNRYGVSRQYAPRSVLLRRPMASLGKHPVAEAQGKTLPNDWPMSAEAEEADKAMLERARVTFRTVEVFQCPHCMAVIVIENGE